MHQLVQISKDCLQEFYDVQPILKPHASKPRVKWKPPPAKLIKNNFDRVAFFGMNKSEFGVVIRNSQGLVLAPLSQKVSQGFSLLEVETLAAKRAIQFAYELDITLVVLEGDSQDLIQSL